jgi:hypothetical protein
MELFLLIVTIILIVLIGLAGIFAPILIGKPRKPYTIGAAISSSILSFIEVALFIYWIIN